MSNQPPPGVGPALSALIKRWRERARLNTIPPNTDALKWAWKNVGIAQEQCASELEAALSGSVGGLNAAPPWQDIATAPKDEKRVLLFNPDEGNFGWGIQTGAYYEQLGGWQYDGQNPRYSNAHQPTLWMPLPALPASPVCAAEKKA